jgi:serine/threonine protein kinase
MMKMSGGAPFSYDDVFCVMRDILQALKVLHRNDFVHLDIKPANILRKNQRYKLGDFGLAIHITRGANGAAAGGTGASDVEEGDSRYMARELLSWGPVEDLTKCDIFSLGATCYEIGCFPAQTLKDGGQEWHDVRSGVLNMPPGAPQDFVDIVTHMMREQSAMRPSATQLCETYVSLKTELEKELIRQKICNDGLRAMLERTTQHAHDSNKPRRASAPLRRHNTVT